jgi:hypothetical protein
VEQLDWRYVAADGWRDERPFRMFRGAWDGRMRRMETVTLWRPTGPEELALVEAGGWRGWPARLPDQPIFYPVLNEEYATRIARDWNVKVSGVGYVTRFQVEKPYLDRWDVHQAGGQTILEYWIPAEDLDEFNRHIVGLIAVVAEYK